MNNKILFKKQTTIKQGLEESGVQRFEGTDFHSGYFLLKLGQAILLLIPCQAGSWARG